MSALSSVSTAITVELRPGEGGAESEQFTRELADAIGAYLRRTDTDHHLHPAGRTLTITIDEPGPGIDAALRGIEGVHRAQRDSKRNSRRHTASAHIAVLTGSSADTVSVDDADLDIDVFRSGGNGGQHAQKNSTAVRVTHRPTGLVVVSQRERSQWRNIQAAKAELVERLTCQHAHAAMAQLNEARVSVGAAGGTSKTFTHNTQRGEVIAHATGARWRARDFARGRFDSSAPARSA